MSSSDDEWPYIEYGIEFYEEGEGPPLIKKKSRLIWAVTNNNVDILEELLDSPEWYNVTDQYGYSLLQIAILRNNAEVFDYMLSIPNFPLEFATKDGETALMLSLTGFISNDIWMDEHFALELVNKDACIDKICFEGNTPLHCAIYRSYNNVAQKLISLGVELNIYNDDGETPLDLALYMLDRKTDIIAALLTEGAQVSIDNFASSVFQNLPVWLQENLFFYSLHDCSEITFGVIMHLANTESPLFFEIIKYASKNVVVTEGEFYDYFKVLCRMNFDCLKILIREFGLYVSEALDTDTYPYSGQKWDKQISLENLDLLLQNDLLKPNIINIVSQLDTNIFEELFQEVKYTEKQVTEMYLFLLSYGFSLHESDLQLVYKLFGYCDLFKNMLHMNFEPSSKIKKKRIICEFIYDLKIDLKNLLELSYQDLCTVIQENNDLFNFFAHPKLNEVYHKLISEDSCCRRKEVNMLASLTELARNSFRKFFIHKFNINSCRQFYTLLKLLPVNNFLKKIITYERKLYFTELEHSPRCIVFHHEH